MRCRQRGIFLGISVLLLSSAAYGQEISREQIKGLDEQVQENQERCPGHRGGTESARREAAVSFQYAGRCIRIPRRRETFRLDSVEIRLDGTPLPITFTPQGARTLKNGGVQRIYTGNVRSGKHDLQVSVIGKTAARRFPKIGALHGQ